MRRCSARSCRASTSRSTTATRSVPRRSRCEVAALEGVGEAIAAPDPTAALRQADVVVTATSLSGRPAPGATIEPGDVPPSALVLPVDYAAYVSADLVTSAATFVVDHRGHFEANRRIRSTRRLAGSDGHVRRAAPRRARARRPALGARGRAPPGARHRGRHRRRRRPATSARGRARGRPRALSPPWRAADQLRCRSREPWRPARRSTMSTTTSVASPTPPARPTRPSRRRGV